MIYFRNRKYGSPIDSSFFLKDGPNVGTLERFMLGDLVSVGFRVDAEKASAFETVDRRMIGNLHISSGGGEQYAHIPCVVVQRQHIISWQSVGEFRDFGMSITLEAQSGIAEDLLLWIVLRERPAWAE